MNSPHDSNPGPAGESAEELRSALFAHMVMQQTSMAMMLLGKQPHPETGQIVRDLEGSKLFIDSLEMLEFKTKGNLTQDEAGLLKQSLMSLRMAFVEAVDSEGKPTEPKAERGSPSTETPPTSEAAKADTAPGATATEEEHRKKFTKKY